jgi:HTH-type transcriptional regulator/antitoxin HipB
MRSHAGKKCNRSITFVIVIDRLHVILPAMQIRNAKEIGALVREHRSRLKLSQAGLAQRVGVSRLWIVLLEKGKSTAQLGLVLRTLDILGVTLEAGNRSSASKPGSVDLNKLLKARTGQGTA